MSGIPVPDSVNSALVVIEIECGDSLIQSLATQAAIVKYVSHAHECVKAVQFEALVSPISGRSFPTGFALPFYNIPTAVKAALRLVFGGGAATVVLPHLALAIGCKTRGV